MVHVPSFSLSEPKHLVLFTYHGGDASETYVIRCKSGVSQGSILGPPLTAFYTSSIKFFYSTTTHLSDIRRSVTSRRNKFLRLQRKAVQEGRMAKFRQTLNFLRADVTSWPSISPNLNPKCGMPRGEVYQPLCASRLWHSWSAKFKLLAFNIIVLSSRWDLLVSKKLLLSSVTFLNFFFKKFPNVHHFRSAITRSLQMIFHSRVELSNLR